jgi:hypothetical protein
VSVSLVRLFVAFFGLSLEPSQTWLKWWSLLLTGLFLWVEFVNGTVLPLPRDSLWVLHLEGGRFWGEVRIGELAHVRLFDVFGDTSTLNWADFRGDWRSRVNWPLLPPHRRSWLYDWGRLQRCCLGYWVLFQNLCFLGRHRLGRNRRLFCLLDRWLADDSLFQRCWYFLDWDYCFLRGSSNSANFAIRRYFLKKLRLLNGLNFNSRRQWINWTLS